MAKFRYASSYMGSGELDEHGNVVPGKTISMYGLDFNGNRYTEVPDDLVAYVSRRTNRVTGVMEVNEVLVVDKLRGNSHFEEQSGGADEG